VSQNIKEFINGTLLGTAAKFRDDYPYFSFALIFTSIELLGKCLDDTVEFEYYHNQKPSKFFDEGLKLFPSTYQNLGLYKYCRNGFAHGLKPQKDTLITLAERRNLTSNEANAPNLCAIKGSTKKVLFIENFYDDFEKACQIVISKIDNGDLKHPKVTSTYLPITQIELDY
jgi:hypothetical protein